MKEESTIVTVEELRLMRRQLVKAGCILFVLVILALFVFPIDSAYADENSPVNFSSLIDSLKTITSVVLLPIGILIAGWRIAYLAIFCAMAGIDPLGIMDGRGSNSDGTVSTAEAVAAIKQQLAGFVKGLCWVGGVWIVFQLALTVAQTFANTLSSI